MQWGHLDNISASTAPSSVFLVTPSPDTVSGLMFAGDFVGMSQTPKGLQKQIEKARAYTRTWRVTANVKKCAVVVCNEDTMNPVNLKMNYRL